MQSANSARRQRNYQYHHSKAPKRPPMSIWYHELENPDEAFVLPFFRYLVQLQRNDKARDQEWFQANGVGGGAGMSARSVKSQDAKLSAPHYVLEAARQRQMEAARKRAQSPQERQAEEEAAKARQAHFALSPSANAAFMKEAQREKALGVGLFGRKTSSKSPRGRSSTPSRSTPTPAGGLRKTGSFKENVQKYQTHLGDKSYMQQQQQQSYNRNSSRSTMNRSPEPHQQQQDPINNTNGLQQHHHHQSPPSRLLVTDSIVENSIKVKPIPVRIPDTVIFMRRMPRAWFTYDEDAKMALRLPPLSLDTVKIFDHFSSVAPNSDGICALYFASAPAGSSRHHFGSGGISLGRGGGSIGPGGVNAIASSALVVEPLRPSDLQDFLGGRPSVLDRCPDGALQKYVPTNGKSNTVYEVLWTPSSCGVYPSQINSIKELPAAAIRTEKELHKMMNRGTEDDVTTSTSGMNNKNQDGGVAPAAGLTVASLHDQCFGMIGYFLQDLLRSERRKIVRFSGLFRVDNEQRVWLLGSTCVRCAPMNEPFNNAIPRMPMGLLRPAPFHAPRLDLTTPTLIVGRPPPERPPSSSTTTHSTETYHPFFFTPLHLTKPFSAGASAIDVAAHALPRDLLFSALEHEHELMHFVRETDAFLGCEVSPGPLPRPPSSGGKNSNNNNRIEDASCNGSTSYSSMKYSNRGASLRFRNHARLNAERQAASLRGRLGLRNDGDDAPEESEDVILRREFEESLKTQMMQVREFVKKTAELVTETLLDALSGGLSLNMKNDDWCEFVGTIVMYLDATNWRSQLKTAEDQKVIIDALQTIGCVGYQKQQHQENEKENEDSNENQQQQSTPPPPVFCFDKLEQPELEFGPASELTLIRDERDPRLHLDGVAVTTPRLSQSHNTKSLQMAIRRFGNRTITPEATEWLWKLQRTFETTANKRIEEAIVIHRDEFNVKRAAEKSMGYHSNAEEQLRRLVNHQDQQEEVESEGGENNDQNGVVSGTNDDDNDSEQNAGSAMFASTNALMLNAEKSATQHPEDNDDDKNDNGQQQQDRTSPWSESNPTVGDHADDAAAKSSSPTTKKKKKDKKKKNDEEKNSDGTLMLNTSYPEATSPHQNNNENSSPLKSEADYADEGFEDDDE